MKSTRALIAFAYVADQFAKTNDIAQGLVPLFAPLISARAGRAFDPKKFADDVKETYDLDMHPYVAEQFAPALAQRGYLQEDRRDGTVHYKNLKCEIAEPPIREEQLRDLIDGFVAFATPRLKRAQLSSSPDQLQAAFLDRLVRPEFLALILRPDQPSRGPRTLGLTGDKDEVLHTEQHFDYLVASYMLHLHQKQSDQFDLLVAATSGALVSEVIVDLQHPLTDPEPLADLPIAVDSPLILDALGLGLEGAKPYATQLIDQIKKVGAVPVVFDGTVEEIRRVLRAPLQHHERNEEVYGPLGRRFRYQPALAPYVRSIIPKIEEKISELDVEIYEIAKTDRADRRQFFSETREQELGNSLGDYPTEDARQHDAGAVADVLRLRGKEEVQSIRDAKIVFVTRNLRLARLTRIFLTKNSLMSREYFPPCITDRYLAGLLWISSGGGGDSLSRLRLVANCSAAVVPRRELVSRMHKFFETLNPTMVSRFEALMTNERAEYFLMDRALSDATLITQENYEERGGFGP